MNRISIYRQALIVCLTLAAVAWPVAAAAQASGKQDKQVLKQQLKAYDLDYAECWSATSWKAKLFDIQLKACDRTIVAPAKRDSHWSRVAVLHQRRAALLYGLERDAEALAALELSEKIGAERNDELFNGSTAIGNHMLRALLLSRGDNKDAALSEIAAARQKRPYSVLIMRSLDAIENHIVKDFDVALERMTRSMSLNPDIARALFPINILRGNIKAASEIADDVSSINPKPIGGWTVSGENDERQQFAEANEVDLMRAYVWHAMGDKAKAASIIAGVRADIGSFSGSAPMARTPKDKVPKYKLEAYEQRVSTARSVGNLADRWEAAIKIRETAGSKLGEELLEEMDKANIKSLVAALDILRRLKFANADVKEDIDRVLKVNDLDLAAEVITLDIASLPELLPPPEQLSQVPLFARSGDGVLSLKGRELGFSQAKEKDSDIRTIRFGTQSGTGPMADELGLLAVATYAANEGKDSFIILSRRSLKRNTTVSGMYVGTYTYDSGHEAQYRVILLDSRQLPREFEGRKDRLIDVKTVIGDIKPRYDRYEALKD